MLDTRKQTEENSKGFTPNVQNEIRSPKTKGWMWFLIILLTILTVGLFWLFMIPCRNWLNRKQEQINTSASNISVQLVQRKDTLVKLLDATKSHMKYEKSVLTDITKLRSLKTADINQKNMNKINNNLDKIARSVNVQLENYPRLQSSESVQMLMAAADINEREIAAARRIYNADVNEFNMKIFTFPSQFIAARKKLYTFPLFEASEEQKKDVKLDLAI